MRCRSGLFVFSSVLIFVFSCFAQTQEHHSTQNLILEKFSWLPLGFEQNVGQAEKDARFVCHAPGYTISFLHGELSLALAGKGNQQKPEVVRVSLIGSNENVEPQGIDTLPGLIHYYVGNDPTKWTPDVPQFRQVRYHNIYPGVDLIFYGNHRQLEFDFDVAPGADVSAIKLKVAGATLHKHGWDLDLVTPSGNMAVLKQPELFQGEGPSRLRISGRYSVNKANEMTFLVGPYDHRQPLVIDPALHPALIYSTFMSLSNSVNPFALAVDGNGAAYLAGQSVSSDGTHFSAFVAKFDFSSSSVLYQTFLGGAQPTSLEPSDVAAAVYSIAVDGQGNAYTAGMTHESDFPTTAGAYSTTSLCATGAKGVGCIEPFAAKFDSGGKLVFSTFLVKSSALDTTGPVPSAIAVDSNGAVYLTGTTVTQGLTVAGLTPTAGAFQTARKNDSSAFIVKLHPDGSTLDYATYLGGSKGETPGGIAVDSNGIAYVDGGTSSLDFPITAGQTANSATSAFFTKLAADGSGLVFSTTLAGPDGQAEGTSIAIDSSNAAYITGMTTTSFAPPQFGEFSQPAFAAKFDPSGNLIYSKLLGTEMNYGLSLNFATPPSSFIAPDSTGAAYIASGFGGFDNSSMVFSKLDSAGTILYTLPVGPIFAVGGGNSGNNFGGAAIDSSQNLYVAGFSGVHEDPVSITDAVPNLGTTIGAFQTMPPSGFQSGPFLQKYVPSLGSPVAIPNPRLVTFSTILQKGVTSTPRTIVLSNLGDSDLTFNGSSIGGANATDFAILGTNNTCGTTVTAGMSCSFLVTFTPTVSGGTRNAVVNLNFGGGLASQTVALTGQAGFPVFQASPSPFDFGSVVVGNNSGIQPLKITNTGTGPLHFLVTPPAFIGTNAGDFGICVLAAGHCGAPLIFPASVAPGTSITLPMLFTPSGTGTRTAQMVFQTDAPDSPETVQLTGNGLPQGNGGFSIGAASGGNTSSTITAGQTATYSLAVSGSSGLNVAMSCSGAPAAAACGANPNSFTLLTTGQNVTVSVSTTSRSSAALLKGWPGTGGAIAAFIGLVIVSAQKRYRRPYLIATGMLVLAALVSCGGGGGSGGGGGGGSSGTPAGTYTIVVTGTANGASNNLSLTLTVN